MQVSSFDNIMQAYAQDAVHFASQFNKNLDYTSGSIGRLEELCIALHNGIPGNFLAKMVRKGPSDEKIMAMARILGAYLGEVLKRQFGGYWHSDNTDKEENNAVLIISDLKIFPVAKLYKRLKDGSGDDVFKYYFILSKQLEGYSKPGPA